MMRRTSPSNNQLNKTVKNNMLKDFLDANFGNPVNEKNMWKDQSFGKGSIQRLNNSSVFTDGNKSSVF